MPEKSQFKREVALLILGATITASSVFFTDYLNEKRLERKENVQKKLEFNYQLSKDLGKRFYVTFDLYRQLRDTNAEFINEAKSKYCQSKEEWNIMNDSYQSLLKYYYGNSIHTEFVNQIFNPLVNLGDNIKKNAIDSTLKDKYIILRNKNLNFIKKLYVLANK